ncbi:major centromere autoantigen B-like [Gigantopelta aegis]|uniref:major centromere autoantigen B-like n=1 Tax=Gigantopelta aegis TaxID=1735272 RepID=UPI001B88A001|nr:major centromere autoantigen B-like [Gigantopelta aegis]
MTERPAKRRRVELSLDDKLKIIKSFESVPKPTFRSLSEKFSIGKSTVGDIIKKREVYKAEFEKNISGNKRRFNNACKFDKLNELVWQWFCQARAKNISISGPIIQEKASEFAKELAVADFKGSNVMPPKTSAERIAAYRARIRSNPNKKLDYLNKERIRDKRRRL